MTTCFVYRRISDDREGRELGIARQLEDCLSRAEREDWTVVHVYTDNDCGASTRSRKRRPEYAAMIEAAERGEADVILAYSTSRLTRRPLELEDLVSLHERTGVRLCTAVSGDDDLSTADGRMVARIKASVDAAESERTAERVARAARQRAEGGKLRGRRCFGYAADGSLVPTEAAAIADAVDAVLSGASLHEICRRWDAAGLTRLHGGSWREHPGKAREVLTAHRIAGIVVYRGEPLTDVEATWPAIITPAQLARVREILLAPERRTNTDRAARRALLSGIVTCGRCGSPLRSSTHESRPRGSGGPRSEIYRCAGTHTGRCHLLIRRELADDLVTEAVVTELLVSDLAALAPDEVDRVAMAKLAAELEEVAAAQRRLAGAIAVGVVSLDAARPTSDSLAVRHEGAQRERTAISRRFAPAAFLAEQRDRLLDLADDESDELAVAVGRRFDSLDLGQRRAIIDALLTVSVRPGHGDRVVIRSRTAGGEDVTPTAMSVKTLRFV